MTRLGLFGGAIESSMYMRILEPIRLAATSIQERPLFGFGIGVDKDLLRMVDTIRSQQDVPLRMFQRDDQRLIAGNTLFSMIWQYGVIGSALIWFFIIKFLRHLAPGNVAFGMIFIVLLSLSVADLHTPSLWGYAIILISGLSHASARNAALNKPIPDTGINFGGSVQGKEDYVA